MTGYLRPAVKHGAVEIWIDALMKGGARSSELRACDVFILLVSRHSVTKIAIIRERACPAPRNLRNNNSRSSNRAPGFDITDLICGVTTIRTNVSSNVLLADV